MMCIFQVFEKGLRNTLPPGKLLTAAQSSPVKHRSLSSDRLGFEILLWGSVTDNNEEVIKIFTQGMRKVMMEECALSHKCL